MSDVSNSQLSRHVQLLSPSVLYRASPIRLNLMTEKEGGLNVLIGCMQEHEACRRG